jgi:RHS repeat-associated protein
MHDGLGSARQLVDSTGGIVTSNAYDPFGVPLTGGGVSNPYRYTGEAGDAEVELLYLRARYYQPEVGRFVTRDPWTGDVWRPETLNGYVYVGNNPVNYVDPSGRDGVGPGGLFPELHEQVEEAPSPDIPPVVRYIHEQMVDNARGPIVTFLWLLNLQSSLDNIPDWPDWNPVLREGRRIPAVEDVSAKITAYVVFGYMVQPGGPWDPKTYIGRAFGYHQEIADHCYYYDIWGNIMFGYLGTAAGFSESELLNGAGLVQIPTDVKYAMEQNDPCRLPRPRPWYRLFYLWAWDHPEDRVTAKIGIRLWKAFSLRFTPEHIIRAVDEAGDKHLITRHDEECQ